MTGPPRHVVIDVRKAFDGGIGRHVREITRRLPAELPGWRFTLLVTPGAAAELRAHGFRDSAFTFVDEASPKYGLSQVARLPRLIRRLGCDLFHTPHYVLPPRMPCPSIVTIHDVIHLKRSTTRLRRWYAELVMRSAARSARLILTVSQASATDIAKTLHVPPERIVVVGNGVTVASSAGRPGSRRRGYVLYVGSLKPHKNVATLIEAFGMLARDTDLELWLAGHWQREDGYRRGLERQVDGAGLRARVRFIGRFPESSAMELFQGARVFVSPSWEEGFGLPALEALAHATPVVASRRGAHIEVLGDAARYVDGSDAAELAAAIRQAGSESAEETLLRVERARLRAALFPWEAAAAATARSYREALG